MDQKELMSIASLSIWLDTYDDIFSDFDSRPITERALSDDFIHEARKMIKEKPDGQVELKLLLPEESRDSETESEVIKSIHRQFNHFASAIKLEMKSTRKKGYLMCITGFVLMISTAYIGTFINKMFYISALQVILEPAGWFLTWTGFDQIFANLRKRSPEVDFNEKMAHSEIIFRAI
jgi:hypothetical protein